MMRSNRMVHFLIAALLLGLYFFNGTGQVAVAAGFDCARAASEVEKNICESEQLSALDTILTDVYAAKLKHTPQSKRAELKQEQRSWLQERDECIGYLPSDQWFCLLNAYKNRIVALGGAEQLIAYYKQLCAEHEWDCVTVADLERERGNMDAAVQFYGIMCDANRDGDFGNSCFNKASIMEQQGKVAEAKALYIATCQLRQNNEACGAALRLSTKAGVTDNWTGLYRSEEGTVFIGKKADGTYTINMDTLWANGHMCGYSSTFTLRDHVPVVEIDPYYPECKPNLVKDGSRLSIEDPTGQCRAMCGVRASFEGIFYKE